MDARARKHSETKNKNLPKMSNVTLENVSCNCSAGQNLLLSHQARDLAFDMVMHLTAST